jgi:2-hydroxychromene-2-carboxylate isomerase
MRTFNAANFHAKAMARGAQNLDVEAHAASGHWGVPTFVFENEPFFGQDRIELLIWRMEARGLTRRAA